MRASVIIPTLDAQDQIGALLERLLAQDGQAAVGSDAAAGTRGSGSFGASRFDADGFGGAVGLEPCANHPGNSAELGPDTAAAGVLADPDSDAGHVGNSPAMESSADSLRSCGWDLDILVVDSSSQDATADIVQEFAARYPGRVRFMQIPRESFDYGGTRDLALRQTAGDYVLFLSQDALPADGHLVENLLAGFSQPDVAGVYARHVARTDAPMYEQLTREFNYPPTGRVWSERDIARYGVKAYFFSDTCAAYRRDAYLAVGGFDAPIETNEDMLMAAKLLHAGYGLAYVSDAVVLHSHDHALRQEFDRYRAIGSVMWQYRERLWGADASSEGGRMVGFVLGGLLKRGKVGNACLFLLHAGARYLGCEVGKHSARRASR